MVVFCEPQMVGQLFAEKRLEDLLTNVPTKDVKIVRELDALLVRRFLQFVPVKCRWNRLDSFYVFKEVYTVFSTLRFTQDI